jgi:hypothetical protein
MITINKYIKFLEAKFPDLKWIEMAGPFAKIGFGRSREELKLKLRYGTYYNTFFIVRFRCKMEGNENNIVISNISRIK